MGSLSDSVDSGVDVAKDILSAIRDLDTTMGDVNLAVEVLSQQMDELIAVSDGGGGGGGGGGGATGAATGGRRGGGGRAAAPGAPARGGAGGGMGAMATVAAVRAALPLAAFHKIAGQHIMAGAQSAARGGDFRSGFEMSVNNAIADIPLLGEALDLKGPKEARERAAQRVTQGISQLEAIAGVGAVGDKEREFLFRVATEQEERIQESTRRTSEAYKKWYRENRQGELPFWVNQEQVGAFISPHTYGFRKFLEWAGHGVFK